MAIPGNIIAVGRLVSPGGEPGSGGGVNAFTDIASDFTVPAIGANTDVTVTEARWIVEGQIVYIGGAGEAGEAGCFRVAAIVGNILTLTNIEVGAGGPTTAPPETGTEYTLGHVAPQFLEPTGGYTFGIMFSVSENGYLKEVSWYKTVDEAPIVNHSFIIWDEAGVPIWNGPPDSDSAVEGWITHRFAIPMPLSAGNYRLGLYASNGYGTADAYYPHVDGPLSSESGCYIQGNGYPASSSVAFYCFDLVFAVSAGGEVSKGGINYSTEEQDTGLTWIDGKTIYQKTVDFGVIPDNAYKEVAHNIVGLDQFIDIRGVIKKGAYFYTIPPISLVLTNQMDLYLNATMIMLMTGTAWNAATAFFTIQYTKLPPLPPAPVISNNNSSTYYYIAWNTIEIYGSNFRDTDTLVIEGIDHSIVFVSSTNIHSSSTATVGYPEDRDIPIYVRSIDGQVSNTLTLHVMRMP